MILIKTNVDLNEELNLENLKRHKNLKYNKRERSYITDKPSSAQLDPPSFSPEHPLTIKDFYFLEKNGKKF